MISSCRAVPPPPTLPPLSPRRPHRRVAAAKGGTIPPAPRHGRCRRRFGSAAPCAHRARVSARSHEHKSARAKCSRGLRARSPAAPRPPPELRHGRQRGHGYLCAQAALTRVRMLRAAPPPARLCWQPVPAAAASSRSGSEFRYAPPTQSTCKDMPYSGMACRHIHSQRHGTTVHVLMPHACRSDPAHTSMLSTIDQRRRQPGGSWTVRTIAAATPLAPAAARGLRALLKQRHPSLPEGPDSRVRGRSRAQEAASAVIFRSPPKRPQLGYCILTLVCGQILRKSAPPS